MASMDETIQKKMVEVRDRLYNRVADLLARYGEVRIDEILRLEEDTLKDWAESIALMVLDSYSLLLKDDVKTNLCLLLMTPDLTMKIHSAVANVFLLGFDAFAKERLESFLKVAPDHESNHPD